MGYRDQRNQLLGNLPRKLDFVNLNALRPAVDKVRLHNVSSNLDSQVYRMTPQLHPSRNAWMGNYIVSRRGAQWILEIGKNYDTSGVWDSFDKYMLGVLYSLPVEMRSFKGYAVQTNRLSMHCERYQRRHRRNVCKVPDERKQK